MRKITKRSLGFDDKMVIFQLIAKHIALNGVNVVWVVGGPGVVSQQIKKITLNFEGKT